MELLIQNYKPGNSTPYSNAVAATFRVMCISVGLSFLRWSFTLLLSLKCRGVISAHCIIFASRVQAILLPQPPK